MSIFGKLEFEHRQMLEVIKFTQDSDNLLANKRSRPTYSWAWLSLPSDLMAAVTKQGVCSLRLFTAERYRRRTGSMPALCMHNTGNFSVECIHSGCLAADGPMKVKR